MEDFALKSCEEYVKEVQNKRADKESHSVLRLSALRALGFGNGQGQVAIEADGYDKEESGEEWYERVAKQNKAEKKAEKGREKKRKYRERKKLKNFEKSELKKKTAAEKVLDEYYHNRQQMMWRRRAEENAKQKQSGIVIPCSSDNETWSYYDEEAEMLDTYDDAIMKRGEDEKKSRQGEFTDDEGLLSEEDLGIFLDIVNKYRTRVEQLHHLEKHYKLMYKIADCVFKVKLETKEEKQENGEEQQGEGESLYKCPDCGYEYDGCAQCDCFKGRIDESSEEL